MAIAPWLQDFIETNKLSNGFIDSAPNWFNPIADRLFDHQRGDQKTLFVGVNGSQGSGKSTLCSYLADYLTYERNLKVAVLSLDDFYFPQSTRLDLAETIHPLFKTRGVPGTHDIELIKATLGALKKGQAVALPRFDKAIDNPADTGSWPLTDGQIDIVLFEGWCWGVTPELDEDLIPALNELERQHDKNGTWRGYVNQMLHQHYLSLYQQMDFWVMLKAPNFDCVASWRKEQEAKLRAANPDKPNVMSEAQIDQFVQYFERLTKHGLATLPQQCDVVLHLDANRTVIESEGLA